MMTLHHDNDKKYSLQMELLIYVHSEIRKRLRMAVFTSVLICITLKEAIIANSNSIYKDSYYDIFFPQVKVWVE